MASPELNPDTEEYAEEDLHDELYSPQNYEEVTTGNPLLCSHTRIINRGLSVRHQTQ